MEREDRYLIFKYKDIEKYLAKAELRYLELVADAINSGRSNDGKSQIKCVVVEDDWPQYEDVWSSILDE